jgi:uncharacterized membrane protein YhaH (DUF805 family)
MQFFKGKIGRKQYWLRVLGFSIAGIAAFTVPIVVEAINNVQDVPANPPGLIIGLFYLFGMVIFIGGPVLSAPPRLRDLGHSGWMALIGVIPIIGFFCIVGLLVYCGFFSSKDNPPKEEHVLA